jgi:hypothetical protein
MEIDDSFLEQFDVTANAMADQIQTMEEDNQRAEQEALEEEDRAKSVETTLKSAISELSKHQLTLLSARKSGDTTESKRLILTNILILMSACLNKLNKKRINTEKEIDLKRAILANGKHFNLNIEQEILHSRADCDQSTFKNKEHLKALSDFR